MMRVILFGVGGGGVGGRGWVGRGSLLVMFLFCQFRMCFDLRVHMVWSYEVIVPFWLFHPAHDNVLQKAQFFLHTFELRDSTSFAN